jgi:hypothetical protein
MMRQEHLTLTFTGKLDLKHYQPEPQNGMFISNLVHKLSRHAADTEGTFLLQLIYN